MRIDEAAALLRRADTEIKPKPTELAEVSELLRQQLNTLRSLASALDTKDQAQYLVYSDKYWVLQRQLSDIGDRFTEKCEKEFLQRNGVGRLPPEVIQANVRLRYERFRECYNLGLVRNPTLTGRVTVRFVIDRQGHVSDISLVKAGTVPNSVAPDQGTESFFSSLGRPERTDNPEFVTSLADEEVITCLFNEYRALVFPPPDGGNVTVVYPILFKPSNEKVND